MKKLRSVLWSATPSGEAQPFIKRFVRKGYRSRGSLEGTVEGQSEGGIMGSEPAAIESVLATHTATGDADEIAARTTSTPDPLPQAQTSTQAEEPLPNKTLPLAEDGALATALPDTDTSGRDANYTAAAAAGVSTRDVCYRRRRKGKKGGGDNDKDRRPWLGYAILAFREDQEATRALSYLGGREVAPGFVLRLKRATVKEPRRRPPGARSQPDVADEGDQATAAAGVTAASLLAVGMDPDPFRQIAALNKEDVMVRLRRRAPDVARSLEKEGGSWTSSLAESYRTSPRAEKHHKGHPVPPSLLQPLCTILDGLLWPAKRHRAKVISDHYLVIWRGRPRDGYDALHAATEALMQWADPAFPYTHVAVTKNFRGSPHTDTQDTSHQYAISFGSFTKGGQLCVESEASA